MDTAVVTLIITIPTLVVALVPIVLRYLDMRERKDKEIRDYKRQDVVAVKAAEVAHSLRVDGDKREQKLDELKSGQRDIHILVNSNLTAAKRAELVAIESKLALLRELLALRGTNSNPETSADIEATTARVKELSAELIDRLEKE